MLLSEPGSRYDIIFDFKGLEGKRIIMENIGGDEPFGGDLVTDDPALQVFGETDRIMAFDVVTPLDTAVTDVSLIGLGSYNDVPGVVSRTRKVALFEGKDEFGRLQPLLGSAEPATDFAGNPINWPNKPVYAEAVLPDGTSSPLVGPMEGSIAWHSPTTENPTLDTTEEWEIWNVTGDAHPVHLHLVHFEILGRQVINFDTNTDDDGFILAGQSPVGDGVYMVPQATVQHNSVAGEQDTYGMGFKIVGTGLSASYGADFPQPAGYVENAPKDMVTALPGQITRIKAHFDKPGRYVWHCHILSHEDHEMMRVLYVGPGA
jgi:FtsP/CotA-like multicopper oxidase with cupredoxin domain